MCEDDFCEGCEHCGTVVYSSPTCFAKDPSECLCHTPYFKAERKGRLVELYDDFLDHEGFNE